VPLHELVPVTTQEYCIRELDRETIILTLEGDEVHALDEVGTFIWKAIDSRRDADSILEMILTEYEVSRESAARDLEFFLGELVARGLIELREARS